MRPENAACLLSFILPPWKFASHNPRYLLPKKYVHIEAELHSCIVFAFSVTKGHYLEESAGVGSTQKWEELDCREP